MPPKGKKGRGQTLSLNEFQGDDKKKPAGEYDWVEDDWDPDADQGRGDAGGTDKRRVYAESRYKHESTRLGTEKGFRDAPEERLSKMVPKDMPPPFVAHLNNLANGISEEELRDLFHEDVVVRVKLVAREKSTFAFVEFTTVDALYQAILRDGEFVKRRPIRVDIASPEQIERMARGAGGGRGGGGPLMSRDGMGAAQQPGVPLDRDTFGEVQPRFGQMRSSGSLTQLADLSRDVLGSAQPPSNVRPNVNPDLSGWRDSAPAVQPSAETAGPTLRENRHSGEGLDRRPRRAAPTGDAPSGGGFGGMGNWRNEAPEVQPQPAATSPDVRRDGPRKESAPSKAPVRVLAKPSAPDGGSRWGDLRK